MLHASCHCGAVQLEIARKPRTLTECNCSTCGRYGARWAYYSRASVAIRCKASDLVSHRCGKTSFVYHHCKRCGCVTHYTRINIKNNDRLAVNARMIDEDELGPVPIRRLDVRRKKSQKA